MKIEMGEKIELKQKFKDGIEGQVILSLPTVGRSNQQLGVGI